MFLQQIEVRNRSNGTFFDLIKLKRQDDLFSSLLNSTQILIWMCVLFHFVALLYIVDLWESNCSIAKENARIFAIGSIIDVIFEQFFFPLNVFTTHIWLCHVLKSQSKCVTTLSYSEKFKEWKTKNNIVLYIFSFQRNSTIFLSET